LQTPMFCVTSSLVLLHLMAPSEDDYIPHQNDIILIVFYVLFVFWASLVWVGLGIDFTAAWNLSLGWVAYSCLARDVIVVFQHHVPIFSTIYIIGPSQNFLLLFVLSSSSN